MIGIYDLYIKSPKFFIKMPFKILYKQCIINDNALFFLALLLILHYSLPILKNNDNAISLFLFSNAQGLVCISVQFHQ